MELQQIHFPFSGNPTNNKLESKQGYNLFHKLGVLLLLIGGAYTIHKLTSKPRKNEPQN